ncbi:MAG TPA: STAS domain-containing protein, partial [Roseiflexaceae bacterium]|nr:STAS domain-containing protein [Roseiflexaceae bacterium]
MTVRAYRRNQIAVVEISGRFDAHVAPEVKILLERADTPSQVIVNLSGVNFIDSTALATLVGAMKRCRQKGGDLHLFGLQKPVRIIFELTKLDRAFELFDSEDAAVKA